MSTYGGRPEDSDFPRGPGLALKALALLIVCAGLLVVDGRSSYLRPVREGIHLGLTPLVWLAAAPHALSRVTEHWQSRERLLADNRALRARQLALDSRLRRFEALQAENDRLRDLLSSSKVLDGRVLIAEVLAINQDPYRQQIVLDKGAEDGVYLGQALVDAHGVLGQVIDVRRGSSVALLVTDPLHGLPVEVNRTGLQTIAQGQGEGQTLRLPFLPGNADVKQGDLLVSSALGGRFPPGYPVGIVQEVRHSAGAHFKEAIAYPAARLNQGRQVLLVWSERQSGAAGEPPGHDDAVPGEAAAATP